ncbi:hypothetical protein MPH_12069 [Macrophomina phaseolina MS6]|uniref:Uncharacterized protein n=1 Tax=Macrophomina phaseolina (strain MS6) TaxID=1126212 RepID=K2R8T1_MACPH|nr:hypothetical protein MPH_12069 [Macrophomina phaseolina MS6]
MSLIRYGTSMYSKNQLLEEAARQVDTSAKRVEAENQTLTKQNMELKAKLVSLEDAQAEMKKWKERMPRLTHYLKQWPLVMGYVVGCSAANNWLELISSREVNELRGQLEQLGYAVPKRDYAYREAANNTRRNATTSTPGQRSNGAHTRTNRVPTDNTQTKYAKGRARLPASHGSRHFPTNDSVYSQAQTYISGSSSGRKRKLSEYDRPSLGSHYEGPPHDRPEVPRTTSPGSIVPDFPDVPGSDIPPPVLSHAQQSQAFKEEIGEHCEVGNGEPGISEIPRLQGNAYKTKEYLMTGAGVVPAQRARASGQGPMLQLLNPRTERFHQGSAQRLDGPHKDGNSYHIYDKRPEDSGLLGMRHLENRAILGAQSRSGLDRQPTAWLATHSNDHGRNTLKHADHSQYNQPLTQAHILSHDPVTPLRNRPQVAQKLTLRNQYSSPLSTRVQGGEARSVLSPGVAGLSANARIGTVSERTQAQARAYQSDWSQQRSLNSLSFVNVPYDRRRSRPLFQGSGTATHGTGTFNGSFTPHNPQRSSQGFTKLPEEPRLSSSYFNAMPPPRNTTSMPRPYQTPRMQLISQFAPRQNSQRTLTRDDALDAAHASRGHATPSFYQHQARGTGVYAVPDAVSMNASGLFSSAGGRRSVRR